MKRLTHIPIFAVLIFTLSSLGIFVEGSTIPDWVKNNALWWAEDKISESDYISSLQYLVNQGIISIPITEVIATNVKIPDSDKTSSITVWMEGEIFGTGKTFYTFSEFQHLSKSVKNSSTLNIVGQGDTPEFFISGIQSKDKKDLYSLANMYFNPERPVEPFKVKISMYAGDGSITQVWDYRKCSMTDYFTYLNTDKESYRYGEKDESEWRDVFVFSCSGFGLQ